MAYETRLIYRGSRGDVVDLDCPAASTHGGLQMMGTSWEYDLGERSISSVARAAREARVTALVTDPAAYDLMRRVFDRDVQTGEPGAMASGEWEQRAYVTGMSPSDRYRGRGSVELTVVLLDGVWRRERTTSYLPSAATGGDWLDYPHDAPYDYMATPAPEAVHGAEWGESPCRLTIYGPATDPAVTIAGNRYAADLTLPAGSRLVIDGLARTVEEVTSTGLVFNRFSSARRGSGLGSGEYCFQPVPPGESSLSWSGAFGFDLTIYEEEGEPPLT